MVPNDQSEIAVAAGQLKAIAEADADPGLTVEEFMERLK